MYYGHAAASHRPPHTLFFKKIIFPKTLVFFLLSGNVVWLHTVTETTSVDS